MGQKRGELTLDLVFESQARQHAVSLSQDELPLVPPNSLVSRCFMERRAGPSL